MTEFTYDDNIFSDIFKDINGFRPRNHEFYYASPARKQEIWDAILIENDLHFKECQIREAQAVEAFEWRVADTIRMGAKDRKTAIRWIVEAEGIDLVDDPNYICYLLGIPYEMSEEFAFLSK